MGAETLASEDDVAICAIERLFTNAGVRLSEELREQVLRQFLGDQRTRATIESVVATLLDNEVLEGPNLQAVLELIDHAGLPVEYLKPYLNQEA